MVFSHMKSTQKGDYAKWYFIKITWIQRPCLLVAGNTSAFVQS